VQALAVCDEGELLLLPTFDREGNLLEVQRRDLEGVLTRDPDSRYSDINEGELLDYLRREFGFELGLIHVKEFEISWEELDLGHGGLTIHLLPRRVEELQGVNEGGRSFLVDDDAQFLHRWLLRGDFVIDDWGNDMWAGPDGKVHST